MAITPFNVIQGHDLVPNLIFTERSWMAKIPNGIETLTKISIVKVKVVEGRLRKYDFLLVINTNLLPISHRFQVMADYWSNFP